MLWRWLALASFAVFASCKRPALYHPLQETRLFHLGCKARLFFIIHHGKPLATIIRDWIEFPWVAVQVRVLLTPFVADMQFSVERLVTPMSCLAIPLFAHLTAHAPLSRSDWTLRKSSAHRASASKASIFTLRSHGSSLRCTREMS